MLHYTLICNTCFLISAQLAGRSSSNVVGRSLDSSDELSPRVIRRPVGSNGNYERLNSRIVRRSLGSDERYVKQVKSRVNGRAMYFDTYQDSLISRFDRRDLDVDAWDKNLNSIDEMGHDDGLFSHNLDALIRGEEQDMNELLHKNFDENVDFSIDNLEYAVTEIYGNEEKLLEQNIIDLQNQLLRGENTNNLLFSENESTTDYPSTSGTDQDGTEETDAQYFDLTTSSGLNSSQSEIFYPPVTLEPEFEFLTIRADNPLSIERLSRLPGMKNILKSDGTMEVDDLCTGEGKPVTQFLYLDYYYYVLVL